MDDLTGFQNMRQIDSISRAISFCVTVLVVEGSKIEQMTNEELSVALNSIGPP
jgi:hypothetical protein